MAYISSKKNNFLIINGNVLVLSCPEFTLRETTYTMTRSVDSGGGKIIHFYRWARSTCLLEHYGVDYYMDTKL